MSNSAEWASGPTELALAPQMATPRADDLADGLTAEERANQITHGLGLLLSIPAAIELCWVASTSPDSRIVFSCCLYAVSLVLLYAASTLSHSFRSGRARDLSRLLDQVCIYLLIAGSVTPFAVAYWPAWMIVALLGGTWLVALLGIYRKIYVEGPNRVVLWYYVALGWFPVVGIYHVLSQMPVDGGAIVLMGAFCYTLGIYFWLREGRIPYSHAVWHVLVLFGSFGHYAAIRWYIAVNSPLIGS